MTSSEAMAIRVEVDDIEATPGVGVFPDVSGTILVTIQGMPQDAESVMTMAQLLRDVGTAMLFGMTAGDAVVEDKRPRFAPHPAGGSAADKKA